MKMSGASTACALLFTCLQTFAGTQGPAVGSPSEEFNPERFEVAHPDIYSVLSPLAQLRDRRGVLNCARSFAVVRATCGSAVTIILCQRHRRGFSAELRTTISTQLRHALQLRPTGEPVVPHISGGFGLDGHSHPRFADRAGFHLQYSYGRDLQK
jgi:hypothetical protein